MDQSPPGSLSKGFSGKKYWSGLPCPPPADLPNPGIKPTSLTSPALAGGFFTTNATGEVLSGYQKQRIVEFRPFLTLLWIVEGDMELNHGTQRLKQLQKTPFLPPPSGISYFLKFC